MGFTSVNGLSRKFPARPARFPCRETFIDCTGRWISSEYCRCTSVDRVLSVSCRRPGVYLYILVITPTRHRVGISHLPLFQNDRDADDAVSVERRGWLLQLYLRHPTLAHGVAIFLKW